MAKLTVSLAGVDYARTRALFDGTVAIAGCETICCAMSPEEALHRAFRIVRYTGEFSRKRTEGSDARKTDLWHGPGLLSLVSPCHAPHSQVAGQRPRRPCRHRQPRALGLGGAGRDTAGGEPIGRSRRAVERKPAG